MNSLQEVGVSPGSANDMIGDRIKAGEITQSEGVAIGRNAKAIVNKIAKGDFVEHQEIINVTLELGEVAPLGQEIVLGILMSYLGLDHLSIQNAALKQVPDNVRRQIDELAVAEKEISSQGVPTTPKAAYDLGMMAAYRRDYETALEYFQRATEADSTFSEAYKAISWLQQSRAMHDFQRRDYDAALGKLDEARQAACLVEPQDARSLSLQGYIAKTMSQISEAKGAVAAQTQHLAEAQKFFTEAIKLDPEDSGSFNGLGNVHYAQDEMDKAIEYYKRAISLTPNYTAAFNDLALAYEGKMKKDVANSRQWCEKAVMAWEQAYDLAENDPGFQPSYRQTIHRRIRGLKLQCE